MKYTPIAWKDGSGSCEIGGRRGQRVSLGVAMQSNECVKGTIGVVLTTKVVGVSPRRILVMQMSRASACICGQHDYSCHHLDSAVSNVSVFQLAQIQRKEDL